jgi:hypothetical protein
MTVLANVFGAHGLGLNDVRLRDEMWDGPGILQTRTV